MFPVKYLYNQKWLERWTGFRGFTLWFGVYIILFSGSDTGTPDWLVRHEMKHVEQHEYWGIPIFWALYLIEFVNNYLKFGDRQKAYWYNMYEVEAREAEKI